MQTPFQLNSALGALFLGTLLLSNVARGQVTTILHSFGDGTTLPSSVASSQDATSPGNALVQGRDGNFYGVTSSGGPTGSGTAFVMTPTGVVTIIHNFGAVANDGLNPMGALIQGTGNDNNFYGTTQNGGTNTNGTAFSMTPQGTVTILHNFGSTALDLNNQPTSDAIFPVAALIRGTDGNFYGTSMNGGANGVGTAFSMTIHGVVTIIHSFQFGSATDGAYPTAALVQGTGLKFYGTTSNGGANSTGAIFSVTSTGAFTLLHSSDGPAKSLTGAATSDGDYLSSGLILGKDGKFYGTAPFGGSLGAGVVYSMDTQGNVVILFNFGPSATQGDEPNASVIQGADSNFYGTASGTQFGDNGLVFKVTPQGVETVLHAFGDGTAINPDSTTAPADGSVPTAALILGTDGNFYGVTSSGGDGPSVNFTSQPDGTVFKIAIGTSSLASAQSFIGTKGFPVSFQVDATNSPTSYAAANLPAGLSINASSGLIVGIPTAVGTSSAAITITNAAGSNSVLVPITISDIVLNPAGSTNVVLNPNPTTPGFPPNHWTISPMPLPPNLSFDMSSGTLSGTPTVAGDFNFVVTAYYIDKDNNVTPRATQTYSVVAPATFTTWAASYPNAVNANVATAMPKQDGIPNLVKYLCDIDPTQPMTAADRAALPTLGVTTSGTTKYLTLTYRQYGLETGLTISLQTSTNLKTWQTVATPALSQLVSFDPVTGDPIMQVGVQLSGTSVPFLRINVSSP